jgi:polygalacturonase
MITACIRRLSLLSVVLLGLFQPSLLKAADRASDASFNVRAYGAAGDGKQLDSPAIDSAINAASATGGGTVVVPAGTYLCGSIHLKSNIHLVIDSGATILGAPQAMNAYDQTEPWPNNNPYQDGGHCYFHNSLIWGENLTNVSITGNGTINGGGLVSQDKILDRMCGYQFWGKSTPPPANVTYPVCRLGNKSIALKLCRNVVIRDITIAHGGHFAIIVTGCDNTTVDNVTMDTNRDGIDIDCCHNVMVSNCRVNSPNDDGICPKSSYALGHNVLTENLTITNCQVSGFKEGTLIDGTMVPTPKGLGRIKFGTEASGGFRNCTISNCTFRCCRGLALEEVDSGILEDITVTNLSMYDVRNYAIYITTGIRNRGGDLKQPSTLRNISISNVTADHVDKASGIQIMGTAENPVEDIRLSNIRLICNGGGTTADTVSPPELGKGYPEPKPVSAYGLFVRHASGLTLADIDITLANPDARPVAQFEDVKGLTIRDSPSLGH